MNNLQSTDQAAETSVERPVSPQWLGQRRRADHRSREQAADLLEALNTHLKSVTAAGEPVTVIDVGAGTGSNLAWLAPRLSCAQRWILVDHDTQVLSALEHPEKLDGVEEIIQVVGTVQDLPALVQELTGGRGPLLITCSALLDVLSTADIESLAEAISGPAAAPTTAALLSLSVTGEVDFSPAHQHDEAIAAAFNAHQRRNGLLGPDAVDAVVPALGQRGAHTALRSTDWQLDQDEDVLVEQYIRERAAVAVEHDPGLEAAAKIWGEDRQRQLAAGQLRVRVGHTDVLSLPAPAHPG